MKILCISCLKTSKQKEWEISKHGIYIKYICPRCNEETLYLAFVPDSFDLLINK